MTRFSRREGDDVEQFSSRADQWWDENGPFAPLHRLNPIRLSYLKEAICDHFGRDTDDLKSLTGLSILDIGCGGGLVAEPMARLGADVTGVDAGAENIEVAQIHAKKSALKINYLNSKAENLVQQFDVILALEIVEHLPDVTAFVQDCARLCQPGGLVIFSTLNRTPQSFALGIVAAEYILRWLPRGTHQWKKFIKPSELARMARQSGLSIKETKGMVFHPLKNEFALSNDVSVNYFLSCLRAE